MRPGLAFFSEAESGKILRMETLWKHQTDGVDWLRDRNRALLADEPGLGKSAQLLLAAVEPVLVVAPAMVLDGGVWEDEIARWAPGLDVRCVPYSGLSDRRRTANGGTSPTGNIKPELNTHRWGTVIADEAHYLKGRKTKWTEAFEKLRADRIYLATGTPIPNWAKEAFIPARVLHPKDDQFKHYWPWAREWFDCAPTRFSPMEVGKLRRDRTWEDFHAANFGGVFLQRLRDEVLDLPPLTVQTWHAKMGVAQAKVYKQLKEDFVAWLDSGEEIIAWNAAAQLVKLCKAATGLEVFEEGAGGSAKMDALEVLLRDRPRPTLVVGHFRATVAACARVAARVGVEARILDGGVSQAGRRDVVRAFQSGSLPVLCATIDTVGEGLTLVAADQVIRVERSWRPSSNEQVIRRLHRIGQTRPVTVIDLVTTNTVDERVLRVLSQKTDEQMRALGRAELRKLV